MSWNVTLHPKARKGIARLPARVRATLALLLREIELNGPARGDWPNYGK
jgi:mRNA-degrading endonuclease RelE of RelBE toxin-antitoxin system